jgi:hypothetical protein
MKKIILLILTIVIVACSLMACTNNGSDINIVTGEDTIAEYTANAYLLDSWRNDMDDGNREYYITLLLYSNDYYDAPSIDDVKYKTDDGYGSLMEAIEDSTIVVYQMNNELKAGICSYVKIKTNKLIDTKKIYVLLEGPEKYQENTLTKEEYLLANGSLDGWRSVLTSITESTPPYDEVTTLQTSLNNGGIRLYDDTKSQFYYESDGANKIIDGSTMLTKVFVDPMKNSTLDMLGSALQMGGVANFVDGKVELTELNQRLKIAYKIVDNELWIGFETVDGSDINKYDGEIPDLIVYTYDKISCFVVNK